MNKILATAAVVALLAVTGCSASSGSATAPTVEAAGGTETPSPEPTSGGEKSERGNLIKAFGEGAGQTNAEGEQVVDFVVNSITPATCTGEYAVPSENGTLLVLDVAVTTYPELAKEPLPVFDLNPYLMKVVAPNGTTSNLDLASMATYSCLPEGEMLPVNGIGPAENVAGKIVIDSEAPSGTLVIKTNSSMFGWEYNF